MDIGKDLRTYLLTQSAVTDLVGASGSRIYQDHLPENATLPAATFQVLSTDPAHDLPDGDASASFSLIQVVSYDDTASDAQTLANAIRRGASLQGYRGLMDSTWVHAVICSDERRESDQPTDGSDVWRYYVIQDYEIAHVDT